MTTLLSHEWLAPIGGSENVFEQLVETFPGADMACMWNDAPERFGHDVRETWLARSPLRRSKAAALPFMSSAWRRLDLGDNDRIISSTHAFGHHLAGRAAREGRDAFAYVHSPARYIWAPEHDHRGQSAGVRLAAKSLRVKDRAATHPGVHYAANSEFVRERIRNTWHRDASVIHPAVDVERIQAEVSWRDQLDARDAEAAAALPDGYVLGASRFVQYKRLDLAIRIGEEMGLPVVLCGSGPDEERLRSIAAASTVPVHFTGRVSDELLYCLYSGASLFVFLAIEDFGIMPIEAIALGTPVLVNEIGGANEIVRLTGGGASSNSYDVTALLQIAEELIGTDMSKAQDAVTQFSRSEFRRKVLEWTSAD